jgi:hypothetical protein
MCYIGVMNLISFIIRRGSKNRTQQPTSTSGTSELPSLDVAFDLTRTRITTQLQEVDGLDLKANFIKGAATTLVSTGLILQAVLLAPYSHSYCNVLIPAFIHVLPPFLKRALPLLPLLCMYAVVIFTTHQAYKIADYELVPEPRELLENYLEEPAIVTKVDIFKEMVDDYEQNEKKINRKASWVRYSLLALDIEGGALVALLFFQAIC